MYNLRATSGSDIGKFIKKPWKIAHKHTDAITKFAGKQIGDYKHWKERIKDHISTSWHPWRGLLDAAEKSTVTISKHELHNMRFENSTGWDLAADLWYIVST